MPFTSLILIPASDALRKIDFILAHVYCINGPVLPLKSIDSAGLKVIFLRGSTLRMKYFNAPRPTIRLMLSISSLVQFSNFPKSAEVLAASSIIPSIKSSASTTVPSRLFIFPFGSSTIP